MSWFPLSKKQTRTVYSLVTGIAISCICAVAWNASADGTNLTVSTAPTTTPLSQCQQAVSDANNSVQMFHDACGNNSSCLQEVGACAAASDAAANATLSGANDGTSCDNLVSLCPSDNAGGTETAKRDLESAQNTRQSALQDRNAATQQLQQQQQQSGGAQNRTMEAMIALGKAHRTDVQTAQAKLSTDQAAGDAAKTAAIALAQQKMDEINDKLIKLRDDERKKADAATQAQFNWQVACRASAQQASIAKQKEIDGILKGNQALVAAGQRNQSSTGIFGLQYRKSAKRNKQIADSYNEELVQCLNGTTKDGVGYKIAAQKAADEYKEVQANALDLEAQAKQQQEQLQATMNATIASTDKTTAQNIALDNQAIANADEDYQNGMMLQYQQLAQQQQNISNAQGSNLQNLQQTDGALQQATRDAIVARNKVACESANGGDKTQAQADALPDSNVNKQKARDALNKALGYCRGVEASCGTGDSGDTKLRASVQTSCNQVYVAKSGGSNGGGAATDSGKSILQEQITPGGSGKTTR